jgi:hypothetical protein
LSFLAVAHTFSFVLFFILGWSFNALETVDAVMLRALAMSCMVACFFVIYRILKLDRANIKKIMQTFALLFSFFNFVLVNIKIFNRYE